MSNQNSNVSNKPSPVPTLRPSRSYGYRHFDTPYHPHHQLRKINLKVEKSTKASWLKSHYGENFIRTEFIEL